MFKRVLAILMLSILVPLSACAQTKPTVNMAVLKGPTGMGAAYLITETNAGRASNAYKVTIAGAPDALVAQLVTGELDIAALPSNMGALLYKRTEGEVQALSVITLGVLYLLEKGDTIQTVDDVGDRALIVAGRGSTTEPILLHIFGQSVNLDFQAEHAEVVAKALAGQADVVVLPEPFATNLMMKDPGYHVALDLTEAWEATGAGALPMSVVVVRKAFLSEHPDAVRAYLAEYATSVAYANEHPAEAAALMEALDMIPAAVAVNAIPRAHLVSITGDAMQEALSAFYAILFLENPALIGGAVPDDAYYVVAP